MNTIFQVLLRQNFRCGRMESIRAVSMAVFYCAGVDGWGRGRSAESAKIWIYIQKGGCLMGNWEKRQKKAKER